MWIVRKRVVARASVLVLVFLFLFCSQSVGGPYSQREYTQGEVVIGKLTRAYVRGEIDRDLLGGLAGACSYAYWDPDTDDRVEILAAVDPHWHRIVWSTNYQGETRISSWGEFGSGAGQMISPSHLAFSSREQL